MPWHNAFKVHPYYSMYQYAIHFYGWVIICFMDVPHIVYQFCQLMYIWVISIIWLLWLMLFWTTMTGVCVDIVFNSVDYIIKNYGISISYGNFMFDILRNKLFPKVVEWVSECESRSVVSDSLRPHGLHTPWTPWTISPWNSPGQNTGVGSLSLLQEIFPT